MPSGSSNQPVSAIPEVPKKAGIWYGNTIGHRDFAQPGEGPVHPKQEWINISKANTPTVKGNWQRDPEYEWVWPEYRSPIKRIQRNLNWPAPPPDDDLVNNEMLDVCFRTPDQKYDNNFFLKSRKARRLVSKLSGDL